MNRNIKENKVKDIYYFMEKALEQSKIAYSLGEVPVGCIITDENNNIIASSHNTCEMENNATRHSEIIAIEEASKKLNKWRLSDCTMYVTLEPCPMCAGAIINARIGKLVFGASDSRMGACGSLFNILENSSMPYKPEVLGGIMEDQCKEVLQNFFKEKRK